MPVPSFQPTANSSGQAQHTIAGFRYQILQSVLALLQLRPGDELWLEVSEDFSVVSGAVQTDVQVKNSQALRGPPSYSLQSSVIRDAVTRFWNAAQSDPNTNRRLVFLARGGASRERGHPMPDGATGLAYWVSAAIDADTEPLRELLAQALKGSSLAHWLAGRPTDEELRDRLLRRISWQLEERPAEAIRKVAHDQLRSILRSKNLPVSSADLAIDALISLIFKAASESDTENRKLVWDDLETQLDRVAGQKWAVEQRMRTPTLADNLLLSQARLPASASTRNSTVNEIIANARGQAVIWLHGAHGVGKSTLALLIAHSLGGAWVVFDIGPVRNDPMGAISAWMDVAQRAMAGEIDGIIVDNIIDQAGEAILQRMGALSGTFLASGGRVIATSHLQPLPVQLLELGTVHPVAAPYFSEDDVSELVAQEPCPSPDMVRTWSMFLRMSAAGGHPTLVMTKLVSLRARNWPNSALLEDIDGPGEATKLTREASRLKLVRELQELDDALQLDARQLLKRIANVYDRVDEKLAHRLAMQEPVLRNASEALSVLKGTWLESLPQGDLRVSPLLSDIGMDLGTEEGNRLKQLAAEHWLAGRVLNERTLPLCFWNAFLGKHDGVLMKLSETMQGLDADKMRSAAPMLSPLAMFVTDKNIYEGNPVAAASVRILQFAVADALDNQDVATKAAERLLIELDRLPDPIKALLTSTSMLRILLAEADLTPALRIECAKRLRSSFPKVSELAEDFPDPRRLLPPEFRPDMDAADLLMTRMVQKVRSATDFLEMLRAFDDINAEDRNRYLDTISLMYGGLSVLVSSGWAGDQFAGANMEDVLKDYDLAGSITHRWERSDLAVELEIAKSVILDESLGRKPEALTLIDDAIGHWGASPSAIRQKARVLSHMDRHEESAALTLSVEDDLSPGDSLERALALRDGAVSLAKIGEYAEAARLFGKAEELLAASDARSHLVTGMKIERSLALWRDRRRPDAISLAAEILDDLDGYDVEESRQAERSHQYGRGLVGLFSTERSRMAAPTPPPFDFGQASQIELNTAPLMMVDLPSLADNWRLLASADVDIGGMTLESLSLEKQGGRLSVVIERDLYKSKYAYAVSIGHVEEALSALVYLQNLSKIPFDQEDKFKRASVDLFVVKDVDTNDLQLRELLMFGMLDLIASQVISGHYNSAFLRRLAAGFKAKFGELRSANAIIDAATHLYGGVTSQAREPFLAFGMTMPLMRIRDDVSARFFRDMTLLAHIEYSLLKDELLPLSTSLIVSGWTQVGEDVGEDFAVEVTNARVRGGESTDRQAAEVLLVARDWVNHQFGETWFEILDRLQTEQFGAFRTQRST